MKIFVDFDDVVFNTKKFGEYLKEFYAAHGVSLELVQKHYYNPGTENQMRLFDPEGLFSRLEEKERIDVGKLRENFSDQLQNLTSFVFGDVEDFLRSMGKENLYLISFGLPSFQNEKIVGSGISKFVSGCVVTKGLKAQAIAQVIEQMKIDPEEMMFFIDDRVEQIQDVKRHFPRVKTMLLCREEGRYCDQKNEFCDYEIHNLEEAHEIISKLQEYDKKEN